jgi:hypothetical protein
MKDGDTTEAVHGLVLTGFGSFKLKDMLEWIGTEKEDDLLSAFTKWPPIYREEASCTQEEMQDACRYLAFIQDAILEYELQTNPQDEDKEIE